MQYLMNIKPSWHNLNITFRFRVMQYLMNIKRIIEKGENNDRQSKNIFKKHK